MVVADREQKIVVQSKRAGFVGACVAFGVIAVLSVTFAIASASIIYVGPLAPYANRGIGLALLGGIAMPLVAALLGSYRGVVTHLQEVPAILLALSAATIATSAPTGDAAFASVATFVGLTSIMTGGVLVLAGVFRLGFLARFVPYSVIGGFLAATGLLLVLAALGMMTKTEMSLGHLDRLFAPGALVLWLPWVAFAAALCVATRLSSHPLVLPGFILSACLAFYAVLAMVGVSLQEAEAMGLLLGPFGEASFIDGLSPTLVFDADWSAIFGQFGTMLTVAAMAVLGLLLNSSGIELSTGRELSPERELKAVGTANLVAGATGGSVGYHLLGETTLANKMGVTGIAAGLAVSLSSAAVFLIGAAPIASLPVGLMGAVIAFLGFDFLYEWIWSKRKKLPRSDRAIMLLIVLLAGTAGFLTAFSVGLLLATVQFVISYAGIDVVRLRSTAAFRRSSVERSNAHLARLQERGRGVLIYDLSGFLFFGTANGLLERIKSEIAKTPTLETVVIDFGHVKGLDTSASFALSRIATMLEQNDIRLALTGLREGVREHVLRTADLPPNTALRETLDDFLIEIENEMLEEIPAGNTVEAILADLSARHPAVDPATYASVVRLEPNDLLFAQGAESKELFQLVSGGLRAEVTGPDGTPLVVARFLPGSIVGEIAYYAEVPRTASLLADCETTVLRFDLDILNTSPDLAPLASEFHRAAARHLALRLTRMTRLFREAGL